LAGLEGRTEYLIDTNLKGTINCLNYAVKYNAQFIFLSTSRIYPIAALEAANWKEENTRFVWVDEQSIEGISSSGVSERLRLDGYRSLYGTTKLASELIIQEYKQMFDLKTIINRCGVIAGPFQMGKIDQGVIVLWAAKHYWQGKLNYIGYGGLGKQVRDILHIDDLFHLIDIQLNAMDKFSGEIFNAGGGKNCSLSLLELTQLCEKFSGNKIHIGQTMENRTSDLRIYITDNQKVTQATSWKPEKNPDEIIEEIFDWIQGNENLLKPILA
jgi:CDP-paratose 2-epimerase